MCVCVCVCLCVCVRIIYHISIYRAVILNIAATTVTSIRPLLHVDLTDSKVHACSSAHSTGFIWGLGWGTAMTMTKA